MLTKVLKTAVKLFFTIKFFPFREAYRKHSKSSKNVILVYPNKWKNALQYLYSDALTNDLALIKAVMSLQGNFRIQFGQRNMDRILDSIVYFNISGRYNIYGYRNYTKAVMHFVEHMESQGNKTIPSMRDVSLWENKVYMHQEFDRLGIKSPKTYIYNLHEGGPLPQIDYPYLIKEVHSKGAEGIYKVKSLTEAKSIVNNKAIKNRNSHLLFQRLLSIDRDVRIVCIGDEIAYHHWRLNDDVEEWEPTTYKKGKKGDFGNFPKEWREHIMQEFAKLDVSTGGFDMAWEDNDYSQAPYILEISPAYFPNPKPPEHIKIPYGDYKHRLKLIDSWEKYYVLQADRIKKMIVKTNLEKF